jgi:hypothetical protein
VSERSVGQTDELTHAETPTRPETARPETTDPLAALAADLDLATRVAMQLRRDGLVEVVVAGNVVGFIEHVAPVYVVLAGSHPAFAVEIAQRRTLPHAVDALRFAWED